MSMRKKSKLRKVQFEHYSSSRSVDGVLDFFSW